MSEKKICFAINSLAKGGAERVIVNLAEDFLKRGYQVRVVTPLQEKDGYQISQEIKRIMSEPPSAMLGKSRIRNFFVRLQYLKNIWKEEKPDVIVSFIGKLNMMSIVSSRGFGIPVFVSVRSAPEREYKGSVLRILSKTLLGLASGIVVQTEAAKQYFPKWMQKKCRILPNPLNTDFVREKYEGKKRNVIVTVGRMDANKNQKLLIDAFLNLAAEFPELELELYGDGAKRAEWQKYCEGQKEGHRIHFMGRCDRIADRIQDARIFVPTSKVEGMPNALMEAMALGLVAVSTDCPCGGPRTLITTGENGLLYPVDDLEGLTEALRSVLKDRSFEENLSRKAYESAKEWRPEIVLKQWKDYIEGKLN